MSEAAQGRIPSSGLGACVNLGAPPDWCPICRKTNGQAVGRWGSQEGGGLPPDVSAGPPRTPSRLTPRDSAPGSSPRALRSAVLDDRRRGFPGGGTDAGGARCGRRGRVHAGTVRGWLGRRLMSDGDVLVDSEYSSVEAAVACCAQLTSRWPVLLAYTYTGRTYGGPGRCDRHCTSTCDGRKSRKRACVYCPQRIFRRCTRRPIGAEAEDDRTESPDGSIRL